MNVNQGEELAKISKFFNSKSSNDLHVTRAASYSFRTHGEEAYVSSCYVDQSVIDTLNTVPGDKVELYSKETGGRNIVTIREMLIPDYQDDRIRLHGNTRRLLALESRDEKEDGPGDVVRLREPIKDLTDSGAVSKVSRWLREAIVRRFVDYNQIPLRVLRGLDRDEDRNIVRVNDDVMSLLGISPGDKVVLNWYGETVSARCLSLPPDDPLLNADDDSSDDENGDPNIETALTIRIPSSERDKLNVSPDDCIEVRRDMQYVMGEQVVLSLFGILGITLSANQLTELLAPELGRMPKLAAILFLWIFAIWIILWPERQRCGGSDSL